MATMKSSKVDSMVRATGMFSEETGRLDMGKMDLGLDTLLKEVKKDLSDVGSEIDDNISSAKSFAKTLIEGLDAGAKAQEEYLVKLAAIQKLKDEETDPTKLKKLKNAEWKLKQEELKREAEEKQKLNDETKARLLGGLKDGLTNVFKDGGLDDLKDTLKEMKATFDEMDPSEKMGLISAGVSGILDKVKSQMNDIASYKTAWDTRLWGADENHTSLTTLINNAIGVSPFVKQEKLYQSINSAINEGIAYNVEQRAFLDTIADSIATTFDAFDETLKDLVRVQQADSTAYRLGMEASLNKYLNEMFETTEYLSKVSDTVTGNLYQASSLLSSQDAIAFEYQAQKWLGALYSVGMSSGSIGNISSTLGQLASGDVSALDSASGRLLTMSAANAGQDISEMLRDGIDNSEMNMLMASMVEYLQQIAEDTKQNNVTRSEYSKLFGLSVSDIKAAENLDGYTSSLYDLNKEYGAGEATSSLQNMMGSLWQRISLAGALTNLKDNALFGMAGSIAGNPALYSMLTMSEMLDQFAGGIAIPAISVFGNMVDLETTVSDLLKVGTFAGSVMSMIPAMFSGLGQLATGGGSLYNEMRLGQGLQNSIGLARTDTKVVAQTSQSSSTYSATSSEEDYNNANDSMVEDNKAESAASMDESDDADTNDLYDNGQQIIEILNQIAEGEIVLTTKSSTSGYEDFYGILNR